MIGRSIGVLLVVGSGLGLAACGGKAKGSGVGPGAGTGGSSGTLAPPGGYQTPPPTYETPPPTNETPPPIYENPGGVGAEACGQLCNAFVNRTCGGQVITAQQVAACPADCRTLIEEFEPCGAEYAALISCMLRTQFFQDLLDAACAGEEFEPDDADAEEVLAQCLPAADAFEACGGSFEEPGGEDCTPGGGCANCFDDCETCLCTQGQQSEVCTAICNPPV